MQDYARLLRDLVTDTTPRLVALGEEGSMHARGPGKWTPREIVGHLLDSATNNHRRFVLGQLHGTLTFDGYAQDDWVSAQDYAHAPWIELVTAWSGINLVLAHVMAAAPESVRAAAHAEHNLDRIGFAPMDRSQPATLDDLMRDYVGHLHHHLRQILGARVPRRPHQKWTRSHCRRNSLRSPPIGPRTSSPRSTVSTSRS